MNRTTHNKTILMCALLGIIAVGQVQGATLRYQGSGDYNDIYTNTLVNGWQDGGGGPGGLPGPADTIRLNWGNNVVTLTNEAPTIARFQIGVDEPGHLVVSGGKLCATNGSTVGNNSNLGVVGRLTVNAGGEVNVTNWMTVGSQATGILTIDGGTVNLTSHQWIGTTANGAGTIYITNGGVLNVGGNIGLGTINASTPSGGKGFVYVQESGILNLTVIDGAGNSVQPGSVLDISGSGLVIKTGNYTNVMSAYTNAAKITAYGGLGTVGIDYDNLNPGKTTLFAIPGEVAPTEVVWNPAANFPDTNGLWNVGANWTGGVHPASVTKVIFNVPDAIPCKVTNAAFASHVVMGDNGPGGSLIITNGGILACGADNPSVIGNNSNALMVVENGGAATFGNQLSIGLNLDSDGTLIMNGGTVSVDGLFSLGYMGGKGTAQINGGRLNVSQWEDYFSISYGSVLDITGTGVVVINGDRRDSFYYYVSTGQITNSVGTNVVVDYNNIFSGKTTIYPEGLYVPPEQVVWDPARNYPDTNGLWSVSSNWSAGIGPSNVTTVVFNVLDAIPCTVDGAASAKLLRMGVGGPGGTLIITNGGNLSVSAAEWSSVGYNNTSLLIVEDGGSASFGNHLWVGFDPGADGTIIMNGGTITVGQMFGLGWSGGTGTAQINGGTLNLTQLHPTDSIKGASVLNITGEGKVVINGNHVTPVGTYVSAGKITANGGPDVYYSYDSGANKTTVSAVLPPAPRQSITDISVSGGTVSITYETTAQHTYYIESSPSLLPAVWTPVAGSTNVATGATATFTFPAGGGQVFYRTVAP